ncbi:MAG TPA: porin [Steroidobacteraceae bacterium]|nr:porin [Steroidobacteraceae bacterium]
MNYVNAIKKHGLTLSALLAATGVAQAQSAPKDDDSLTMHGITLYGIVDVGLQNQTHGAPISDYFPAGSADIVQKNSNKSITGITPNNLSQSRIGVQGVEPLFDLGDLKGVFKLETFFNPQSGQLSDALKSLTQNNGRSVASGTQNTNLDSSVAGQIFQQSYAGISSKTFGTLTFGRQNTLLADGISKYDPNAASQAFSLIGLSGTTAGAGDTQDRRLDGSLKYTLTIADVARLGAMFKPSEGNGIANSVTEIDVGGDFAGLSLDAYYVKAHDAIAASALSAAQVALLPGLGFSPDKSVAATVSDNTSYSVMALYNFGELAPLKIFAGYEHIKFANPSSPLPVGFDDIGGYKLAFVNNAAFPNDKVLQVYWGGVKYMITPSVELTGAYYGYKQNSYGAGASAGCSDKSAGTCSGTLDAFSADGIWHMSKRFDSYLGVFYTGVHDGMANGYAFHTTDLTSTVGVRFKF